ncbi:PilZ domain-containing protein [Oceanobacillus halophilus]|uniref:PilZ domain-containing protein n=1 Tax=Oceanobacillus halophilus TaxID=930130 RepID=UPI00131478D6|nr:PilZ domain-containing protein [Oceanobacillus halophilus]
MKRYNRDEPFRYTFGTPLEAVFQIIKVDDQLTETSNGKASIIDLSLEGIRLNAALNFPDRPVQLAIWFVLNDKEFNFTGDVVWKKQSGTGYDYGLLLKVDDDDKNELITQLKTFAKEAMK